MASKLTQKATAESEREPYVGRHVRRIDSKNKVDGSIKYGDDIPFEGYHATLVRSNIVHGTITNIETEAAENRPGVLAVVTGEDLVEADWIDPFVGPAFRDMPVLAVDKVRFLGEPVVAVIAENADIGEAAAGDIFVDYDRLPNVENVFDAREDDAPLLHGASNAATVFDDLEGIDDTDEPNVAYTYTVNEGDLDAGFEEADVVLDGEYSTPMIQHTHLEPFVATAEYDNGANSFRITTGNQTPHFVEREVARIFDLPTSKVTVEVPQMGGSYGAKTYARIEPLVAALSRFVKAPVKLRQSSSENFDTAVRDGTETRVKTGATKDGEIVAQEVEVIWDTGAYADIGPRKAKKAGYTAPGAYDIPNVEVISKSTYTNKPPGVAYRGFGVAQTAWAVESHLDDVAREIGVDPYEIRAKNAVRDDGTYNGSPIAVNGVQSCLDAVAEEADWDSTDLEQPEEDYLARGRGIAVTLKATITPSTAEAIVLLDSDGSVNVVTGGTKVGQGVATTMAQLTADAFEIDLERVSVNPVNTDIAPFNTSTTSSRTTFHVGNAILKAVDEILEQVCDFAAGEWDVDPDSIELEDGAVVGPDDASMTLAEVVQDRFVGGGGTLIGKGYYSTEKSDDSETTQPGNEDMWQAAEAEGDTSKYQSAFWMSGASVVDVIVDEKTGRWHVDRWFNATDAGKAIDPDRVEGQILGAATQGLGHVQCEEMIFEGGQQINKSLLDYKVPYIEDMPEESVEIIVENGTPDGPHGAKGVGEANTVTVPPAIGNAIFDAVGVRITSLPATPEKVLRGIANEEEEDQ